MSSLEVAGVIGTWVAAFIAIVALVSIVGPVLIWLASRTDRQKALDSVGRDNNGFISNGYHLGPNIYLGRRIRVPRLKMVGVTRLFTENPRWNAGELKEFDTPATWVRLGALLRAYGVEFGTGDDLVFRNGKTYLPVHPSWILALGLIGRYSYRRDKGRLNSKRGSLFRLPTLRSSRNISVPPPSSRGGTPAPPTVLSERESLQLGDTVWALYGITGAFRILFSDTSSTESEFPVLAFDLQPVLDLQLLVEDALPVKDMFLLSIGFIKLKGNIYVSLTWSAGDDDRGSDYSSEGSYDGGGGSYARRRTRPSRFEDGAYLAAAGPSRTRSRGIHTASKTVTINPESYPDPNYQRPPEHGNFRIQQMEIDPSVLELARPFTGMDSEELYILQPQNDRTASREVEAVKGFTYVPAEAPWIRLDYVGMGSDYSETYIARSDAQKLAHALLLMPWHPEGYLIGGNRSGVGMQLLTRLSERLLPIMGRVKDNMSFLSLGDQEKRSLLAVLDPALRRLDKSTSLVESRSASGIMYKLDQVLERLGSGEQNKMTDLIIGILMITNYEFQELVYQSIRHLKETTASTIQLDMRATTLKVPSAFGIMQHFYVDMDLIAPEETRSHETVSVSHTVVVLAAMRSTLRSMMLRSCFDADPLLDTVVRWKDVVYVE
jgi:hypothetical protein